MTKTSDDVGGERFVDALREAATVSRQPGPCPDDELLARLVFGQLGTAEEETLQLHLTACTTCASLHDALAAAGEEAGPLPTKSGLKSPLLERLAGLVSFEMPGVLALATRAATTERSEAYETAMEAYREGRHETALEGLEAAHAAGESFPALRFYLGACLMGAGRAAEAVAHLREAADGAPKMAEYRLIYAQSLLLLGDGEEAEKQLRRTVRLPGRHKERAKQLAKDVRELLDSES